MLVTIGMALAGIIGKKPAEGIAKLIGIIAAVLLVATVLGVGKCAYDSRVIDAHQARQDAANANADLRANENSSASRAGDTTRLSNEARELERVNDEHPDDARARRIARQRCLRSQQEARAAGRQPPAC